MANQPSLFAAPFRILGIVGSLSLAAVGSHAGGAGGPASDLHTIPACRLFDTRLAPGALGGPALAAGATRTFIVVGQCGIPLSATAIAANMTVVSPTALGHLRLYASGTPQPSISSINYGSGQTRSNNAVVALGADGAFVAYVGQASGTVHLVLDVTGYFGVSGCSPEHTPASPGLTVNTGTRALSWDPVHGATSYNLYIKGVAEECGLVGPQMVTRNDQLVSDVSSPFDVSGFNQCGLCYFVDVISVSGDCESPLQSDSGQPAIGFSLLPCVP